MSKLIDVDELVKALDKSLDEACKDKTDIKDILVRQLLVGFAKQVLSAAPTVEAISVEWIKKYAKKGGKIANILFPFEIEMMLEDWEKENAKDD